MSRHSIDLNLFNLNLNLKLQTKKWKQIKLYQKVFVSFSADGMRAEKRTQVVTCYQIAIKTVENLEGSRLN